MRSASWELVLAWYEKEVSHSLTCEGSWHFWCQPWVETCSFIACTCLAEGRSGHKSFVPRSFPSPSTPTCWRDPPFLGTPSVCSLSLSYQLWAALEPKSGNLEGRKRPQETHHLKTLLLYAFCWLLSTIQCVQVVLLFCSEAFVIRWRNRIVCVSHLEWKWNIM